ncbi:MAG: type II secretion system protein [Patescibacteria group bacterium]|jgi:prepilin-type N-terminal cleavage/methylation domain-containing protein
MSQQPTTHNPQTGFTLIELTISIAIFGILAVTVLTGFRNADRIEAFRHDASLLASDLRAVQNRALAGALDNSGEFPRGGYGLRIEECNTPPCTYLFWREKDDPPDQRILDLTGTEVQGTTMMSKYTKVLSVVVQDPGGLNQSQATQAQMSFKPPRPTPFVWWAAPPGEPQPIPATNGIEGKQVMITLSFTDDPTIQRVIEVKGISGQISVYAP